MSAEWYVLKDGGWKGPISSQQLRSLVSSNEIQQTHQVRKGRDGNPIAAGRIKGLFPDDTRPDSSINSVAEWYYAVGGQKSGPICLADLKLLVKQGTIKANDLIWKVGLPEWRPASSIAGFFSPTNDCSPHDPALGTLLISRLPKFTGFVYPIRITVDGIEKGMIGGGFPKGAIDLVRSQLQTLKLLLPEGEQKLEMSGGGLRTTAAVQVVKGQVAEYQVFFSELGKIGGGINFSPFYKPSPWGRIFRTILIVLFCFIVAGSLALRAGILRRQPTVPPASRQLSSIQPQRRISFNGYLQKETR